MYGSVHRLVQIPFSPVAVPAAGRNAAVGKVECIVRRTVVGRQKYQVFAASHLLVKIVEKGGNVAVEAQVGVLNLNGIGAHLVPNVVGARAAHGQQVGHTVGAKGFALNGRFGHVERDGVAKRRVAQYAVAILLAQCGQVERQRGFHARLYAVFIICAVGGTLRVGFLVE